VNRHRDKTETSDSERIRVMNGGDRDGVGERKRVGGEGIMHSTHHEHT
jgi:hypothetical protein